MALYGLGAPLINADLGARAAVGRDRRDGRLAVGRTTLLLGLALALGGCAAAGGPRLDDLGGACQILSCVCAARDTPFWQEPSTTPILWKENGDASCPEGYELRKASPEKPKGRR